MPAAKSPSPRKPVGRPNGTPKTGGRKAGTPNKIPSTVKAAIEQALIEMDPVAYLKTIAVSHPAAFASLLGRIIPIQVTGANGNPIDHSVTLQVKFVGRKAANAD